MKRLFVLTFIFVFAVNSVGFAAIGGSRMRMAPRPSINRTAPPPASNYKPSAPARSYTEQAPAAKPSAPQTAQPAPGGFMRGFGMFGGGMLLGGLFGNMLGNGMFAGLLGMLVNIMLLAGVFMAINFAWNAVRNRARRDRR